MSSEDNFDFDFSLCSTGSSTIENQIKESEQQFDSIYSLDKDSISNIEENKDELCEPLNLLNSSFHSEEQVNEEPKVENKINIIPTNKNYPKIQNHFQNKPSQINSIFNIQEIDSNLLKIQVKTLNGSLLLQNMLDYLTTAQINILFMKFYPFLLEIMCCQYGNYFMQKFFLKMSFQQRMIIIQLIKPYFLQVCFDKSGTHAIQALMKALQYEEEKDIIEGLIRENMGKLIMNENGYHIIQKVIIEFIEEERSYLNEYIIDNLEKISENEYGALCINKFIIMNKSIYLKFKLCQYLEKNFDKLLNSCNGCSILLYSLEKFEFKCCEFVFKEIKNKLKNISKLKEHSLNFIERSFILYKKFDHKSYSSYIWKIFENESLFNQPNCIQQSKIFFSKIFKTLNEEQKDFIKSKF